MNEGQDDLANHHYAEIVQRLTRRQAALGLRVAAIFIVLIGGLPLYNMYNPHHAATSILGFPATWLFLGILFFPITWLLSAYFVRESDRIELEAASAVQRDHAAPPPGAEPALPGGPTATSESKAGSGEAI
ncbi:MAG TPA: DUF485 domain-containing protein [Stellaceae bacterium]|nr:DUF485 domain-containing protein [Stellaceae bacterium]